MNIADIYSKYLAARQNVCTDTRKIIPGCMFFALRGDNFNGNDFAQAALSSGASFAVVDDKNLSGDNFIYVEDTLRALQQLANFHRKKINAKVIALTGSNGKTTTKELINAVCNKKFKTLATVGNLNNHIGVPLTLLSLRSEHEFAIIEMGANHLKEIELLCTIAEPDFGLITNVGKAHLEGFGSFEGVMKAKGELYEHLKKNNKLIFVNDDNMHLKTMLGDYANHHNYGTAETADCTGAIISSAPFLKISWHAKNNLPQKEIIQTNLTGSYNFENVLAAVCIGNYFIVKPQEIKKGIENYFPSNQRSQVVEKDSNTFILDYYNANPTSMEAALLNFNSNYKGKKIAILGDMLELGNESHAEHLHIINLLKKLNLTEIILIGKEFSAFSGMLNAKFFNTSEEAAAWMQKQQFSDTSFLIKGSRGLKLENALNGFKVSI